MATLYAKPRSPFYYLRYRDLDTGEWRGKSTKLRKDIPAESRKALKIAAEHSKREAQVGNLAQGTFAAWVPTFLEENYSNPRSRKRYTGAWEKVSLFLKAKGISHPRQFRWEHVEEYLRNRKKEGVKHNTARLEIKAFGAIMQQAVRLDYCDQNPLFRNKIRKDTPSPKRALTLGELDKIRKHLARRPKWMQTVFEIQSDLGCRFSECSFGKEAVDLQRSTVILTDAKRSQNHPRKKYRVPMRPRLTRYLRKLFKTQDFTVKPLTGDDNTRFNKELRSVCSDASSHCLRVTFVTRCHQAGVSESVAMRLVNHSSKEIHQIYSKLTFDDMEKEAKKLLKPRKR